MLPPFDSQPIDLQDGLLHYFPTAFSTDEADLLLDYCLQQLPWRQDTLFMFGRHVAIPRLHCWFGDPGATYTWSGLRSDPLPWPDALTPMRQRVESLSAHRYWRHQLPKEKKVAGARVNLTLRQVLIAPA